MEHVALHGQDGSCVPWPQPARLADGRLAVGMTESSTGQHAAAGLLGNWTVLASRDDGRTWSLTGDPSVPRSWPGGTIREKLRSSGQRSPNSTSTGLQEAIECDPTDSGRS